MKEKYQWLKDVATGKKISRRELLFRTGQIGGSAYTGSNLSRGNSLGTVGISYWSSMAISYCIKDESKEAFNIALLSIGAGVALNEAKNLGMININANDIKNLVSNQTTTPKDSKSAPAK